MTIKVKHIFRILLLIISLEVFTQQSSRESENWKELSRVNLDNAFYQFQARVTSYFSLEENQEAIDFFYHTLEDLSFSDLDINEKHGKAPYLTFYLMAEAFRRMEQPDGVMKYLLLYQELGNVSHYDIDLGITKAYNTYMIYRYKKKCDKLDFDLADEYLHPYNPAVSTNGSRLFLVQKLSLNR